MSSATKSAFFRVDTGAPLRPQEFEVIEISCRSETQRNQEKLEQFTLVKVSYKNLKKGYPVGRAIVLEGITAARLEELDRGLKETGLAALVPFGVQPEGRAQGSGLVVLRNFNMRAQDFSQTHTENVESLRAFDRYEIDKVGEFVADQFSRREPMSSFQLANKAMPKDALHEAILSFIHQGDMPELSLAIRIDGKLVAAALNETFASSDNEILPPADTEAASMDVSAGMERILNLLARQDKRALTFCSAHIERFADALKAGKVGHHHMIAGNGADAAEGAFVESMKTFQQKGHEFVAIEATNPWTASMCEKYGGLAIESEAYGDDVKDGLPIGPPELSSVFYVIELA